MAKRDTSASPDITSHELDVAVVGAGVSGVYCAWRLISDGGRGGIVREWMRDRKGKRPDIGLFEYTDRVGGRLFSKDLPGIKDVPIELGGMRFLDTHVRVKDLVDHFRMTYVDLPVSDPEKKNLFYLRGRHFSLADWDRPSFDPPYNLGRGERIRSPGQMLIETALRHRRDAQGLAYVGFWNLLLDEWSTEAFLLMREAGGYESIMSNWSAAEAIPFLLADFNTDLVYHRLDRGFQALPLELAERFERDGGLLAKNRRLHRIDREPDGRLRLTFDAGDPRCFPSSRRVQSPEVWIARHVILAMPRRAIERLHPDSALFDEPGGAGGHRFLDDLHAVLPQAGFKIFAAYRRPWWFQERGVSEGRSVTDLPIRQCYYWHTNAREVKADGKTTWEYGNSALMASYNDGTSVEYWSGLARDTVPYAPPPWACPPGVGVPNPYTESNWAPRALVRELQDQLRELHGLDDLIDPDSRVGQVMPPYAVYYQDWTKEPYEGGWHFWKIGARAQEVSRRMYRPVPGLNLSICGEAWSRQQGWVEGALETADGVLEEILGLPEPSWLGSGSPAPMTLASPQTARAGRSVPRKP